MKTTFLRTSVLLMGCCALGQQTPNADALAKIREEGLNHSQVAEIAYELIDHAGPRLTNSKGYQRAADYAVKQLTEWGLQNATKEAWGEFGKGWEVQKSYLAMTKPYYMPFIAVPKAWTPGTDGEVSGKVLFLQLETEADFEQYKGKLKGAIVATKPSGDQGPTFEPDATRFTDEELDEMKEAKPSRGELTEEQKTARQKRMEQREFQGKVDQFLEDEGVALVLKGARGMEGTFFTSGGRGYLKDAPTGIPVLEVTPEHLNILSRLTEHGESVEVEAEVKAQYEDDDLQGYNVVAEIPGSDKKLKSQLVMLGGHLDSWHAGTGATDNAAGCTVMMEAVRILKATGLTPKRTIRIALWGGEEEGLHGSRNYVKNHFGDSKTQEFTKEQKNVSAYYNIDNGSGRIRGIYLQGNEAARPIFQKWFEPFDDLIDHTTLTINNTGGTDHLAFDSVDIPGFQFIQDPLEYRTRTHHTNMDTYERLELDDLKQMAVIVASFVYNTAEMDGQIPRKPLEETK